MADYRRCYVPGGSFFFTVVTERRAAILGNDPARDLLRAAFRDCRQRWPFRVDALVMLPDHLHAIWTLPPDDADYSRHPGLIEKHFTQCAARASDQALEFADATGSILANSSFNRCSTCHRS